MYHTTASKGNVVYLGVGRTHDESTDRFTASVMNNEANDTAVDLIIDSKTVCGSEKSWGDILREILSEHIKTDYKFKREDTDYDH